MSLTSTPTHSSNCGTVQSSTADIAAALTGERPLEGANEKSPKAYGVADRVGDLGGSSERHKDSERTTEDSESEAAIFWVDWESPGDPMNPKKCVSPPYLE